MYFKFFEQNLLTKKYRKKGKKKKNIKKKKKSINEKINTLNILYFKFLYKL